MAQTVTLDFTGQIIPDANDHAEVSAAGQTPEMPAQPQNNSQNQGLAPAGQTALSGVSAGVQLSGNPWNDRATYNHMVRAASMLSKTELVPETYRGKPEDCFIALELAIRLNTSPIFVMQNLYVVKGKPSWAGQACIAMINACGKFRNVRLIYSGKKGTDERGCHLAAIRLSDGQEVTGTEITIAMARAEGWMSNSKWRNMPEQMLGYRAASFFARLHCPDALMGLQTYEEVVDADSSSGVSDLTDALK